MISFTWDPHKNELNQIKHGISFEEAATVFFDDNSLLYSDPDHSEYEERFIMLGYSSAAKLLVVVHCYRNNESEIRIISARKATKNESFTYKLESRWY